MTYSFRDLNLLGVSAGFTTVTTAAAVAVLNIHKQSRHGDINWTSKTQIACAVAAVAGAALHTIALKDAVNEKVDALLADEFNQANQQAMREAYEKLNTSLHVVEDDDEPEPKKYASLGEWIANEG